MALLDVENSARNLCWQPRAYDDRLVEALIQQHRLPELVARVMAGRGGIGLDNVADFLAPKLRNLLPDPGHLADMEKAAKRISEAIQTGEPVAILGDYDVDGVSSAAILFWFWRALRPDRLPEVYIPDRISEGYGPNEAALWRFHQQGIKLVLLVDCGIVAFEPLAAAASWGMEVIVFDHHAVESALPEAQAVVNPHRPDDDSGCLELCAAGIVFLAVIAINRQLRQQGWYTRKEGNLKKGSSNEVSSEGGNSDTRSPFESQDQISRDHGLEPNLFFLLDLVALATVCDLAPLTGVNRALVAQGLKVMAHQLVCGGKPGLSALAQQAGCSGRPDSSYLGFVLGPRLNAAGRMHHALSSFQLLTTLDSTQARELAQRLDSFNTARRQTERQAVREAVLQVSMNQQGPGDGPLLMCKGEWHPGVIGLVASRLAERFGRPVVALSTKYGKASCRSIAGIDLGSAVLAAQRQGLLTQGGGHAMAAGFSTSKERFGDLQEFLSTHVAAQVSRAQAGTQAGAKAHTLEIDGILTPDGVTSELLEALSQLAPFGRDNEDPRFAIMQARVVGLRAFGDDGHLQGWVSGGRNGRFKVKAFRAAGSALEKCLRSDESLHLAGSLAVASQRAQETIQLILIDAAPASPPTMPSKPQH